MHHAVSAKAVGQKEAGNTGDRSKDAMVIGSHLIQSRPRALRINWKIFKRRYTVSSVHENFFDECWLKVDLIARSFLRIVPRQEEPSAFRPEMEACAHVNDHGRTVRKVRERL